ncbi:hypothetical protein I5U08_05720 [Stenotrophomonas maltophilia]|nr:hypothetical protein [Stenotrophomonas maltophilia]
MAGYSGYGRLALAFEMQGALETGRNLTALGNRVPWLQERTIATVRRRVAVEARRDIQREYNIPAARIRRDLSARNTENGVRITGHFRGVGLRNFDGRSNTKGVSARVFRGGPRSQQAGAFQATLLGGNPQFVERYGPKVEMTKGRYKGQRRQRVEVLYGPTVAQMLGKGRRADRLADFARRTARSEMERQIDIYLRNPAAAGDGT